MKRLLLCFSALLLIFSASIFADPPSRVARLSYIQGGVSYSSAANQQWFLAKMNRPLIAGDRLWTDNRGRAELQLGSSVIRMNNLTDVGLMKFNRRLTQLQLTQGTINLTVRRSTATTYEIDTPQLALVITKAGNYRINVNHLSTKVAIRKGQAIVYGKTASYRLKNQAAYAFMGTNLSPYQMTRLPQYDAFDRWVNKRNQRFYRSPTLRYVSADLVGYEDLDTYGSWEESEDYGHVWVPTHMPIDWAPYRYGHWEWIAPWGWTWVDDAPWGYAPFHYGRWVIIDGTWSWVPGPRYAEPVYAPALVAFVTFGLGDSMAWIPLGPHDVYVPPYSVSENYFTNVNITNTTVINNTYITNVYNNQTTVINYQNKTAADAITAVPKDVVEAAKPIAPAIMPISPSEISKPLQPVIKPIAPAPLNPVAKPTDIQPPKDSALTPIVVKTPVDPTANGDKSADGDKPAEIVAPSNPVADIKPLPVNPAPAPTDVEPAVIQRPDASNATDAAQAIPVLSAPADKQSSTDFKPMEPTHQDAAAADAPMPFNRNTNDDGFKPMAKPERPADEPMPAPIEPVQSESQAAQSLSPTNDDRQHFADVRPADPAPAPVEMAPPAPVEMAPPAPTPMAPPAPAPVEMAPPAPTPMAPPAPVSEPAAVSPPAQTPAANDAAAAPMAMAAPSDPTAAPVTMAPPSH